MKKKILFLVALAILACAMMVLSSCSQWDTPYEDLDREGATVSVKFDPNGGMVASTNGVTIVDVFNVNDYTADASGNVSIPLVSPSDEAARGKNAFEISMNGHVLAGWFITEPKTDADGREIDEDGNLTSESGKEPAKKIVKMWNFATDTFKVDTSKSYTSEEPVLTLTAIWIPYTVFEFYTDVEGVMTKIGSYSGLTLDKPEWSATSGKLNYKSFIKLDGKTLVEAYLDEAMTVPMTEKLEGDYNLEEGTNNTPVIKVYTTWRDGEWTRVTKADQLSSNVSPSGCYELMNDITFSGTTFWSTTFSRGEFTGKIYGNGYTISGINTTAALTNAGNIAHGGIFAKLSDKAEIRDVTFENVTYTISNPGVRAESSTLALFAAVNGGATFENVALENAKIVIPDTFADFESIMDQVTIAELVAEGEIPDLGSKPVIECLADGVTVTVGEGGKLTFAFGQDS